MVEPYKVTEVDHKGSNAIIEITREKRSKIHINKLRNIRLQLFQEVKENETEMVNHYLFLNGVVEFYKYTGSGNTEVGTNHNPDKFPNRHLF
jgi:hypothetical protein